MKNFKIVSELLQVLMFLIGMMLVEIGTNNNDEIKSALISEFTEYQVAMSNPNNSEQMMLKNIKDGKMTVYSFWVAQKRYFPLLTKISMRIFSLITSTASVERSFKYRGSIHTKIRNRMHGDACLKALTIKMNQHLLNGSHRGIKRKIDRIESSDIPRSNDIDLTGEDTETEDLVQNLWEEEEE